LHGLWFYLLIEFCTGPWLASWLEARDPSADPGLSANLAARIVADLAAATSYLHEQGIIHRDITPNNVLLTDGADLSAATAGFAYSVKLADFGLATCVQNVASFAARDGVTQFDDLMRTPDYIAPELLRDGSRAADARSDIFSLGVLLYRLLMGRTPFRGRTPLENLRNIERCHDTPAPRMGNGIARDLETIVLKCLDDHPGNRYASTGQLRADLNHFLTGQPIASRRPMRIGRLKRFVWRHGIAIAVALALAPILILAARQLKPPSEFAGKDDRYFDEFTKSERRRYEAGMERAWSAWRLGDFDEASDIARRWVPGESSPLDFRGADWHNLDALLRFSPETHQLEKSTIGNIYAAQFSSDGSILALGGSTGRISL